MSGDLPHASDLRTSSDVGPDLQCRKVIGLASLYKEKYSSAVALHPWEIANNTKTLEYMLSQVKGQPRPFWGDCKLD
jgi:hypothetical protein